MCIRDRLKVANLKVYDLLNTPTCIEHRREESVVSDTLLGRPFDRLQDRVNLVIFQVIYGPARRALEWDGDHFLREIQLLGVPRCYVTEERMNGRQPYIACRHTVIPLILQMRKE